MLLNIVTISQYVAFLVRPESFTDKELYQVANEVALYQSPASGEGQIDLEQLPNNYLAYPRLGIRAPISWDIPEALAVERLAEGLVHIEKTSKPSIGGEILITGHSSYYWWREGNYKNIFANLLKAEKGDKIIIHRDKIYIYSVVGKYQVNGNETLTLESTGEEVLNLMTCVPLGTDLRRLIVEAKLVFTD